MALRQNDITVFFFGSPGEGFSSHPKEYLKYVKTLDLSQENYELVCDYKVDSNRSIIKYVEYGLKGYGQDATVRGGRNFGMWIEIKGFKIEKKYHNEIIEHIRDFIQELLIEEAKIFDISGEVLKYNIFSLDEIRGILDKFVKPFIEHFIEEFNDCSTPISEIDIGTYSLSKKEKENEPLSLDSLNEENLDENQNTDEPFFNEIDKNNAYKIIAVLKRFELQFLWFFVLGLLISHVYHINRLKQFERIIYEELNQFKKPLNQVMFEDQSEDYANFNYEQDKVNETITTQQSRALIHQVKSGENLGSIVRAYNTKYSTEFTTEKIAEYNDIEVKKENGITNYPLNINQKINFPE